MGFKTQVFNLQVLTQTEFETPPKSQFKPEKGHFLVYFNRACILGVKLFRFCVAKVMLISDNLDIVPEVRLACQF